MWIYTVQNGRNHAGFFFCILGEISCRRIEGLLKNPVFAIASEVK